MSDRLESMLDSLRGQHPPAPFAPAEAVRRRGRQRARRQVALAGVAVLAVGGVGTGVVAAAVSGPDAGPGPVASPPATATSTPTSIPARWLLTAADLGPGDWQTGGWEPEWAGGPDRWRWEGACPGYRSEDFPSLAARLDQATVAWTDGTPQVSDPGTSWVHQVVDLFPPGAGGEHMRDIRGALALCRDGPDVGYEITETGFAGDESMLVREEVYPVEGDAVAGHRAVVRVGDAVTTIGTFDIDARVPERGQPARLRELARHAADRMR